VQRLDIEIDPGEFRARQRGSAGGLAERRAGHAFDLNAKSAPEQRQFVVIGIEPKFSLSPPS